MTQIPPASLAAFDVARADPRGGQARAKANAALYQQAAREAEGGAPGPAKPIRAVAGGEAGGQAQAFAREAPLPVERPRWRPPGSVLDIKV